MRRRLAGAQILHVMTNDYFDGMMPARQVMLWATTAEQQLDRWEPHVAAHVRKLLWRHEMPDYQFWQAAAEHHFALIALRALMRALDLLPTAPPVQSTMRSEIIEARDLLEHWDENMPVFNVHPSPGAPRFKTGRAFAERNPGRGPYNWLGWDSSRGAMLTPNVSAPVTRALLEACQAAAMAQVPSLSDYRFPRLPSPWKPVGDPPRWIPADDGAAP